jgi:hypothetical protein
MKQIKDFLQRTHRNKSELLLPPETRVIVELPEREWLDFLNSVAVHDLVLSINWNGREVVYNGIIVRELLK